MSTIDPFLAESPQIIPPDGGWQAHTTYLVAVSYSRSNPIHRALFHVGFINDDGSPAGYSQVWCNNYDAPISPARVHYMRAIKVVCTEQEFRE